MTSYNWLIDRISNDSDSLNLQNLKPLGEMKLFNHVQRGTAQLNEKFDAITVEVKK